MQTLKKFWIGWLGFRLIGLAWLGSFYTQANFWGLLLWQLFSLIPALVITPWIVKPSSHTQGIETTHAKLMIVSCLVIAVYWANASVQWLLKSYENAPIWVTVYYGMEAIWLAGVFFGIFWWLKKSKPSQSPSTPTQN